jgi:inhibitor of the pro-sigma K processing machinery
MDEMPLLLSGPIDTRIYVIPFVYILSEGIVVAVPYQLIIAYVVGLAALYFLGWLLLVPLKFLSKMLLNALVGGVLLVLLSMVGGIFNLTVSLNVFTALMAGFLGVPGVALVVVLPMLL